VTEAGGAITGMDGSPFDPAATHLLATNGRVHDAMLAVIADVRQRSLNRTN
jgi:fructose-1,6-bisphosphatase/inositol monophosphatase family enzyme